MRVYTNISFTLDPYFFKSQLCKEMFVFWVKERMQVVHSFLLIIIIDQFPLTPLNSTDIRISVYP